MRYFVLFICWMAFFTAVEAQSNLPVIFVKGSYYVLSPAGDLLFNEAFSNVIYDVPFEQQLLVNQQGKFGVIENNKYLFRPEFASIATLHNNNYGRKGYVLEKNKFFGIADGDGKIVYPIRYTSVYRERDASTNSRRVFTLKHGDSTTVVFQKENQDFQTVYSGIVHAVSVYNGMIRVEQGEKSALWTYNDSEYEMVAALPFSKVKVSCGYNEFQVYDPAKKTVRTYTYSNRLLREQKNVTTYEEYLESADMEGSYFDEVQQAVFPEPLILSLDREELRNKKNTRVKHYLTEEEQRMNYKWLQRLADKKVRIEGVEQASGVLKVHFLEKLAERSVRDTIVSIPGDEVVKWNSNQTAVLVKRKDQTAIFSVDGKELYPFTTNKVEFIATEHGIDWIVVTEKKQRFILFYHARVNALETVLQLPVSTECTFMDHVILLTDTKGKKKTIRFVIAEQNLSISGSKFKLNERIERFESVAPLTNYPGLLSGEINGKKGVLDASGKVLIPCVYDSIQCEAYYAFEYYKDQLSMLKPVIKAYVNDSMELYFAEGNIATFWAFKKSMGRFSSAAFISDEAEVIYQPQPGNQYNVFTIGGEMLSTHPLWVDKTQLHQVSYNDQFWYVFGQDNSYKTIVLLSNGKQIQLP